MEGKHWFQSKTVWVNITALVAAVGLFVQGGMTDFNLLLPAAMGRGERRSPSRDQPAHRLVVVTNRALVTMQYVTRALLLSALVAGLLWGFVARIIDGEAYLRFLALILTFVREMRLPYFEEPPPVHFPPQGAS